MSEGNRFGPNQYFSFKIFPPLLSLLYTWSGTYPGNHQGVISTPKHKIFGKMTPSCILQDFLYLFESKEIF